jgi:hypothetical protein
MDFLKTTEGDFSFQAQSRISQNTGHISLHLRLPSSAIFSQPQTITLACIMEVLYPNVRKRQTNKSGICAFEIVSQL